MDRDWRTRPDPFAEVWPELEEQLQLNPGLEAKTLFADLQRRFPGRFADGQLRTLQRRVKQWRAESGPAKEVFFAQVHHPGRLAASDFTHCTDLGVTINGSPFDHLIYHFVLTYSNWETGTICFSESFESLSEGLQNALWELGGVPQLHRTDRLTAAVQPGVEGPESFKQRYQALLRALRLAGPGDPGRQGQRERRRRAEPPPVQAGPGPGADAARQPGLRQPGRLRGVPAAAVRAAKRRPAGRLAEEVALLRPLPAQRLEACKRLRVRVDTGSTIHVQGNVYSVASRLIGEWVEARLYAERGRGVVRPEAGGATAAAARPWQAPHRLPARHRLAGAQAGGVRRLPLPRRPVSQQPLPPGLRRAAASSSRSGRPRSTCGSCTWRPARARRASRRCWRQLLDAGGRVDAAAVAERLRQQVPGAVGDRGDGGGGGPERCMTPYWKARRPTMAKDKDVKETAGRRT